jgi:hypothetical protein
MSRMTRYLSGVLVLTLVSPAPLLAEDHLVSRKAVAARLEDSAKPPAATATAAATALSEAERLELAARADALETDPVAGASKKTLIIVGVVVVVVVILAAAAVDSCKRQGAECFNK